MSIRQLTTELQQKAENELNEVQCKVKDDLEHIRTWLKSQSHIKARLDDQWLLTFLRGTKFCLDTTKHKLEAFCTMRMTMPEFFSNRDPFLPEIQEIISTGAFWIPLSKTASATAPRVVIFGCSSYDRKRIRAADIIKVNLMVWDILMLEDDNFSVAGLHLLQNLQAFQLGHIFEVTPTFLRRVCLCLYQVYPVRTKGVHCIYAPLIFEVVFKAAKRFLSEKLKERVHVKASGDCSNIHKDVPLCILPREYGGTSDSIRELAVAWKKKIESYSDWFEKDSEYYSDATNHSASKAKGLFGSVF